MKKIFEFIKQNILFLETLLLIIFIPLFPKIPLLDIKNTWVYIRAEDFILVFVALTWIFLLLRKKVTLNTPLTLPILAFWLVGAVATIHGVLLVFPTLANVFPNVAFLSLVRHIEYLSVFFIAYSGMRDKKLLPWILGALIFTLLAVVFYGFGQRYLGFPAYLTMNEEFAKGIPIRLSELSRVPSTFAGHYDLAAYLVLVIPILVSLVFGVKNILAKIGLLAVSFLGFILLFMTVSRVSFFVLFAALLVVLFIQKRKLLLTLIPVVAILGLMVMTLKPQLLSSSLFDRFKATVSETDVVVDAKTGDALGHIKFVDKEFFQDKIVLQRRVSNKRELALAIAGRDNPDTASISAIIPYRFIPDSVPLVTAVNASNGESLPQGTAYLNLYLSPVIRRLGNFYYELPNTADLSSSTSGQVLVLNGDFIIKRASAYDLSFTTRFQGEWPRAIEALNRNVLVGSGYGSVSLAVDNNYLRVLGEVGILGFLSFLAIFLSLGIYIKKLYKDVDSNLARSFIVGFSAGVIGLALNATLIDVFEASKIAFLLWTLAGVTIGLLTLYQKQDFNLITELRRAAVSRLALTLYLSVLSLIIFLPSVGNYFVGDDFTWLRWAVDGNGQSSLQAISGYFTNADGFFYRPGAKVYFLSMYKLFWLNHVNYHLVSLLLHFGASALFFVLSNKVLKNKTLAAFSAFFFLIMSGALENVYWISSVGHLFNAFFALLALLFFILWEEKKKRYFYALSIASIALGVTFHELGVVTPLLVFAYKYKDEGIMGVRNLIKRLDYILLFAPILSYLALRLSAQSHWFSGDYSYNLFRLPFNAIGNAFGYLMLVILGPSFISVYVSLRNVLRENLPAAIVFGLLILIFGWVLYRATIKIFSMEEKRQIIFGFAFFLIALLPFLGLGNIASRYSYLASLGIILILAVLVKKVYFYLLSSGREIAIGALSTIIAVFGLFHIIQAQQAYFEWHEAGTKTRNFFISIEGLYTNDWSNDDVEFHFVNVPLKVGEAWVFPVGLSDAVWFAFRNENAKIFSHNDTSSAIEAAGPSKSNHILVFRDNGIVVRYDKQRKRLDLIKPEQ